MNTILDVFDILQETQSFGDILYFVYLHARSLSKLAHVFA
jgi:hypothetical protein